MVRGLPSEDGKGEVVEGGRRLEEKVEDGCERLVVGLGEASDGWECDIHHDPRSISCKYVKGGWPEDFDVCLKGKLSA